MPTSTPSGLIEQIQALKRTQNAVILAHNYQPGPIQDLADYVGDSLAMARWAQASAAQRLVVAGVYFMAETAAILCPDKEVLIPDPEAGCSLAESITPAQLTAWKSQHPDAVVVSYVNTSAEIKALSDYCCTSANAVAVAQSIPAEREILFLPDFFLGSHVARMSGRTNIRVWLGECHVHAAIDPDALTAQVARYPDAEVLIHPECGCTTRSLALPAAGIATRVLSTDGMIAHTRASSANTFIIATEIGLLHRLRRQNPDKHFIAAQQEAQCPFMNMISLEKIHETLLSGRHRVTVPRPIRERALLPLQRMVNAAPS